MKYDVTFYYHTSFTVSVNASSEGDALKIATNKKIDDNMILANLQEDDSPDVILSK